MIGLVDSLPFFDSFYKTNANPPFILGVPKKFAHIRTTVQESAFLPETVMEILSSTSLYRVFIERLKNPKIMLENPQREWKIIFKNLHNKNLSSKSRSTWYRIMHGKIMTNSMLFNQQRRPDPYCEECNMEIDDIEHKIFKCSTSRRIWHFQRQLFIHEDRRLQVLESMDWIFPTLKQCTGQQKNMHIKAISTFFEYIYETPKEQQSVENYKFYKMYN